MVDKYDDKEFNKQLNQLTRKSKYFNLFCDKKHSNLKGYSDYDTVMFELARKFTMYDEGLKTKENVKQLDYSHRLTLTILNQAYTNGFSNYWIDNKLFDAFLRTHSPNILNENNIERPLKTGLLFLPSVIKNPDNLYIKWVMFIHCKKDEYLSETLLKNCTIFNDTDDYSFIQWFTVLDNDILYASKRKIINLNEIEEIHINEVLEKYNINTDYNNESVFIDKITDLILQTILYLQQYPKTSSLIIDNTTINKSRNKVKNSRIEPNIIGKDYQLKTLKSNIIDSDLENSEKRKSPITHWRRGYYKNQPVGNKDDLKYKTIWIEPTLING